jgi:hypothetical protein
MCEGSGHFADCWPKTIISQAHSKHGHNGLAMPHEAARVELVAWLQTLASTGPLRGSAYPGHQLCFFETKANTVGKILCQSMTRSAKKRRVTPPSSGTSCSKASCPSESA